MQHTTVYILRFIISYSKVYQFCQPNLSFSDLCVQKPVFLYPLNWVLNEKLISMIFNCLNCLTNKFNKTCGVHDFHFISIAIAQNRDIFWVDLQFNFKNFCCTVKYAFQKIINRCISFLRFMPATNILIAVSMRLQINALRKHSFHI